MKDYTNAVSWVRDDNADDNEKVVFYIHNKCDERDVSNILGNFYFQKGNVYNDTDAHILRMTENTVAYRVANEVYIIPAKIKQFPMAITTDNDNKTTVHLMFDYPCDMKESDLVRY